MAKQISDRFSSEIKILIGNSRNIALQLGSNEISTIHFLVADCAGDTEKSLKNYLFQSDEHFNRFVNSHTVDQPSILINSLPLTLEAEAAIRTALKLKSYYYDSEVRPYHLFLAAGEVKSSLFAKVLLPDHKKIAALENYYINLGILQKENINLSVFQKLFRKLKAKNN